MTLPGPLEKSGLGGEAGEVLVKDLLCGEALSPNIHCPARAAGSLDNSFIITPRSLGTSRLCPFNPTRGSSFPSKIGEKHSPCSVLSHKLHFSADDISMAISTARRDSPPRRKPAAVVADLISIIPGPTFVELAEAMRVLQEREAQMAFRLTDRYLDAVITKSPASEVCTMRRDAVFHIFKLVEALRLRNLIASHAIAYLDRFLNTLTVSTVDSNSTAGATSAMPFQYIATACVSIAAKMDATAAPSLASLSVICGTCGFTLRQYTLKNVL